MAETSTRARVYLPLWLMMAVAPWMGMCVGTGTGSEDMLCPGSPSAPCTGASSANSSLQRAGKEGENVTRFVHHVIRSSGWKSVVVFSEMVSDADDSARLLADDSLAVTVFQWPLTWKTDHNGTSSRTRHLHKALTSALSPHVLLLGSAEFVRELLAEVLQVKESVTLTFDWLTTVPRDHKSSIAPLAERFDNMAVVFHEQIPVFSLETVVRRGDTTRLSQVKRWSPWKNSSLPSLTEDLVFPNKKYGLGGRTLTMVTMTWNPFVIRHRNENTTWYTGLCIDLLHMLATKLNFTYVISEPPDRNWGQKLSNGTWVGMIGMLHRKEVDFALSGLSITAERATVSDFSRGFFFDEIVLITSFPHPTPVGWTFFTRPFHWLVFLLLGCGFLLLTAMLVLMDRWYSHVSYEQHAMDRKMTTKVKSISLAEAAEVLFGSLVGRAVVYTGSSTSGHVLLVAWLLLSLVAVATYTGKLTSNSVVTKQPVPFKTLSELVERSDYTWGFSEGTMLESFVGNSTNKDLIYFYKKMLEFEKTDPTVRANSANISIPKLLTEKFVRLTSEIFFRFNKNGHCRLTVVRERLAQDTFAVYFQKGSPYKRMFDEVIAHAMDMGILDYLTKKWFPEQSSCQEEETRVMSVSLEQVPVAFLLAAGGLVLASGMLLLEFLTRNNTCLPPQDRTQPACLPSCCM